MKLTAFALDCILLSYVNPYAKDSSEQVNQLIQLEQTACHLGGFRQWFLCSDCNKRVGVLYFNNGSLVVGIAIIWFTNLRTKQLLIVNDVKLVRFDQD